jgi:hypothetical protein
MPVSLNRQYSHQTIRLLVWQIPGMDELIYTIMVRTAQGGEHVLMVCSRYGVGSGCGGEGVSWRRHTSAWQF